MQDDDIIYFISDMLVDSPEFDLGTHSRVSAINLHSGMLSLMELYSGESNVSEEDRMEFMAAIDLLNGSLSPTELKEYMVEYGEIEDYSTDYDSILHYSTQLNRVHDA